MYFISAQQYEHNNNMNTRPHIQVPTVVTLRIQVSPLADPSIWLALGHVNEYPTMKIPATLSQ